MLVRERKEYRVQRWDGKAWRQGIARTEAEAQQELRRRHLKDKTATLRIVCITTTVTAGDFVGDPPSRDPADESDNDACRAITDELIGEGA